MTQQTKAFYEFGPFRLDAQERLLLRDGEAVPLTPKSFDLLLALIAQHGHLLEKEELLKLVWPDTIVEEANLASNISLIRKALGDGENGQKFIETVPKRGYRFVADIRKITGENSSLASTAAASTRAEVERTGFRRYRGSVIIALASVIIAGTVFGLYQLRSRRSAPPKISAPSLHLTPLTSSSGSEYAPSFSPDGNQLAFAWNGEIFVKQINGDGLLRLTTNSADDGTPVWSPDGRHVAFMRYASDGNGIYLVPTIGGPERKLASTFAGLGFWRRPAWSPDGKLLVLADRNTAQEPLSLYLLSVETSEKRRLTSPSDELIDHHSPAFSPDGKTIAFIQRSRRTDAHLAYLALEQGIYLMPADGGTPTRVHLESSGGVLPSVVAHPTWTADGKELVFSSFQTEHLPSKLWRVLASGGTIEEIPVGAAALEPTISAQGNRLAFVQMEYDLDIWRIDLSAPAGRKPPTKFISSTKFDNNQEFSPDGRKIAFSSNRSGKWALWVCDSDGANLRQLTADVNEPGSPRWSADSQQIAFDAVFEGNPDICVINAEGGKWHRLTTETSADSMPSWSQDGEWIYFNSNRSGKEQIWKLPAAGGTAVQVTQQGGYSPVASPDGKFVYYAKKRGAAGIWRVPVTGGEEAFVLDQHGAGLGKHWTITQDGIYFVSVEAPAHPLIRYFSFATGKVSQVAVLEQPIRQAMRGITVSPDKRWLLSTQINQSGSDIMLLENFR